MSLLNFGFTKTSKEDGRAQETTSGEGNKEDGKDRGEGKDGNEGNERSCESEVAMAVASTSADGNKSVESDEVGKSTTYWKKWQF